MRVIARIGSGWLGEVVRFENRSSGGSRKGSCCFLVAFVRKFPKKNSNLNVWQCQLPSEKNWISNSRRKHVHHTTRRNSLACAASV